MRKLLIGAMGLFFLSAIFIVSSLTSCQKDNINPKNVDTPLSVALLTSSPWEYSQVRGVIGNTTVFYVRGGANNSQDLDNARIIFLANGTGTYISNVGAQNSITWNFTDSTYTSIAWTWNLTPPVQVTWQEMDFENGGIHYGEYFTQSGENETAFETIIPAKTTP